MTTGGGNSSEDINDDSLDKTTDTADATDEDPDIDDEMPEILANLGLANEVAHTNLEQQNIISNNQALFQLKYATIAKCVEVIMSIDPDSKEASNKIKTYKDLMDQFVDVFEKMEPKTPAIPTKSVSKKEEPVSKKEKPVSKKKDEPTQEEASI